MKNKLIVLLLTIALIATFGFACGGSEDTPASVNLVNFELTQTEDAVLYGELYELRRVVADEKGKEYSLSYEVKDSTGAVVTVIANCFEAVDLGGYTIVYTAKIAEGDVRTSTVTLPVYDGEGPSIIVGALDAGEINKTYVLPSITFRDLSDIQEKSVKVYLVGNELVEITLTENAGEYSFVPTQDGTYRLSIYAKDSAGNETTVSKDFVIEKILVGEVLNPVSSKAQAQVYFGSNSNVFAGSKKEIVSAEENNDTTYGGSYMRVEAANPNNGWGNIMLNTRFEASEYADYQLISLWVYMESTDILPINVLFFNDASLTKSVKANEWNLITIDAEKFLDLVDDTYFIAARYNEKTTGIRIGEILAVNPAELAISATEEVVLTGESAVVEFTVTANPADTDCVVTITNEAGESINAVALGNGKYQATVSALGVYQVTVSATNGKFGVAKAQFTVVESNRIVVDGEYVNAIGKGKTLDVLGAYVEMGEEILTDVVTVKLYTLSGAEWVDVTSEMVDGKYTPAVEGKIKVEYTYGDLNPAVYEIDVLDYSVIFDPAAENADSYVMFGVNNDVYELADKIFVTAEENTDETYGGAYFSAIATNRNAWGNLWIMPQYTAVEYADYELVTAWIYVVSNDNNPITALFALSKNTQTVAVNKWIQVAIPMNTYIESIETGTPVFIAINYGSTAATGVHIGEISAANYADLSISAIEETVLIGESATVEFSVTANPADCEYVVSVKNANGEALEFVALGNGNYKVAVSAIGEYTVTATAINGNYGVATTTFKVVESVRIVVDGNYSNAIGLGKELSIAGAYVQRGESATDEVVTVKVYELNGAEWSDITAQIVDGKYTPASEGTLKVEYSFEGLDSISFEIAVCDYSVVYNPALADESKVAFSTNNNVYQNAAKVFVSAEENTDEVYGGAYLTVSATNRNNWGNLWIYPAYGEAEYQEYDYAVAWVYVVSENNNDATVQFALNAIIQTIAVNQWIQVAIPMNTYIESIATGTPVFMAINYKNTGITGVRIGEITALNSAELAISAIEEKVLEGSSVNVEFTVTATPADCEYVVSVKNSAGEALEVVALGNGKYQVAVNATGEYTVSATAMGGLYGVTSTQFTVIESLRVIVDGSYSSTTGMGKELTLVGAHVERGESVTDEVVTVKVYELNGTEWVDVSSEIINGKYVPVALGKIKVEYTFEGVDAISFELAVLDPSIIFDPTAENMSAQISTAGVGFGHGKNAVYTFVSDEENTDETYGGAYVKINSTALKNSQQWGSVLMTPAMDINSYSEYGIIEMWVYVERNGSGEDLVSFFGSLAGNNIVWANSATLASNQWIKLQFPMEQFIANPGYLFGRNLHANASWGVTGFRVGKVVAVKTAELAISNIDEVVLSSSTVDVEFSVTANPADCEFEVSVKNSAGEALEVVALGNGNYKVAVSAIGEYTVSASAINGIYGVASTQFTVVESVRLIVDGEYAQRTGMGKELSIIGAHIQRGESATDEVVTVKVYELNGAEWLDLTAQIVDGKYTPASEGTLKVEYSFEGLDSISFEIAVCDYSVVYNPALADESKVAFSTNNDVYKNAAKVFVSAEENTDEVYGGAYLTVSATNRNAWGNLWIYPAYGAAEYQEFDYALAWVYVVSENNNTVNALFALNNYSEVIAVNQWIQVAIPMDKYIASLSGGTPVFIALNYKNTGVTGVRIGEITALNSAELAISAIEEKVLEGSSVNVEFTVTAAPAGVEYAVSVKNSVGEALEVVALGDGKYQVTVTATGEYTVTATAVGNLYGATSTQFTVIDPVRMFVDGEYASTIGAGQELTIIGAHIERGETVTDDVVTIKVYELNGAEWLDVSDEVVGGKYIPTAEGKLKIEYTFAGVDAIVFEIAVLDPSIIFDPTAENMSAQISTAGVGFGHGKNAVYTFVSDEENTDGTYGGAYVKLNSTVLTADANKWGSVILNPANDISSYAEYDAIEMWIYVERYGSGEELVSFFGSLSGNNIVWADTATVTANQWIKLTFPVDEFVANPGYLFGRNLRANTSWGVIGFRVGKITAVNIEEEPEVPEVPVEPEDEKYYVFNPIAENKAQLNCSTGAGFTSNQATFEFVSAANNNDAIYDGAYVKISTTAISASGNKWGDIRLAPEHELSTYAEYSEILVWICVKANATQNFAYSLYGGIASVTVPDNTWVQISIPAEAFVNKTTDVLYALNFNGNASWGRTAVLIGEIVAVK